MAELKEFRLRFFGYPRAVEGPAVPYKKSEDVNPVFHGTVLAIGAWLCVYALLFPRYLAH